MILTECTQDTLVCIYLHHLYLSKQLCVYIRTLFIYASLYLSWIRFYCTMPSQCLPNGYINIEQIHKSVKRNWLLRLTSPAGTCLFINSMNDPFLCCFRLGLKLNYICMNHRLSYVCYVCILLAEYYTSAPLVVKRKNREQSINFRGDHTSV